MKFDRKHSYLFGSDGGAKRIHVASYSAIWCNTFRPITERDISLVVHKPGRGRARQFIGSSRLISARPLPGLWTTSEISRSVIGRNVLHQIAEYDGYLILIGWKAENRLRNPSDSIEHKKVPPTHWTHYTQTSSTCQHLSPAETWPCVSTVAKKSMLF